MAFLKTPLRYPGGKSRAIKKIAQFFPDLDAYTEYREPFLGGGSVAIYITLQHPTLDVWVNDLYEPLYTFWKQLQLSGEKLRDELLQLKQRHPDPSSARNLFIEAKEYLQKNEWTTEPFHKAVSFYIVNKCSFSGLTENSSFSKMASDQNFSITGIDNLPYYSSLIKKWHITNLPFEKCMTDDPYAFIYLDPPYAIKDNLYGHKGDMHKGFDHDRFYRKCAACDCDQMVSYNSDRLIKERFKDWQAQEYDHTYTMRSVGEYNKEQENRKELLLLNYAL
tara:strand:- start:1679 stop:2512 length:834 start_codon:yes stop_codon:yes gene_type:complete